MKKIYSLIALGAVAMTNAQILNGTFDDAAGAGGNDGQWSGISATTAAPASFTNGGWTGTQVYSGKACLRVGSSSTAGNVTTPALTGLNGDGTLTFRAGAWNSASEKTVINVSIIGGGSLDTSSVTLVKGQFSNYTVNITGATPNSQLVFAGTGGANRFFLDDVVVSSAALKTAEVKASATGLLAQTVVSNDLTLLASTEVKIFSLDGKLVASRIARKGESVNISQLNAGIYIATGVVEGKSVSVKFIKK